MSNVLLLVTDVSKFENVKNTREYSEAQNAQLVSYHRFVMYHRPNTVYELNK